jgi:hypothetical protein
MKRLLVLGSMMIGFAWGGIAVWLVGYSAGYEDGAHKAWDTARVSFMPRHNTDDMDFSVADYPQTRNR